jgi:putative ATPase
MSEDGLFEVEAPEPAAPPGPDPDRPVTRGVVEDRPSPTSGVAAPLAVRMRPASLDEVVGQDHLLAPGAPLRRLVEGAAPASVLLHGPPGTGKTTLARLISQATGRAFEALSALNAGVKEVRGVIEVARRLLAAVEDRVVLLVGATTENPSFSVVAPLLSRSLVLGLHALDDDAVGTLLDRAVADPRGLGGAVTLHPDARAHLVRLAAGDGRRSLTALEAAADAVGGAGEITLADVERVVDEVAVRYDRAGDQHYDVISAFIKSIRGSDPDAALHYLARMIVAGEDPRFIARRLVVHASEDVGLADPTALPAAVAAAQAVALIGLPEARINLAQVTIHLATAPKSNAVITAIDEAMGDVRSGAAGPVPPHLRDGHYAGAQKLGNAVGYVYPHGERAGVVTQQYPPDELVGRDYYRPAGRGDERARAERLARLREVVRGATASGPEGGPGR